MRSLLSARGGPIRERKEQSTSEDADTHAHTGARVRAHIQHMQYGIQLLCCVSISKKTRTSSLENVFSRYAPVCVCACAQLIQSQIIKRMRAGGRESHGDSLNDGTTPQLIVHLLVNTGPSRHKPMAVHITYRAFSCPLVRFRAL